MQKKTLQSTDDIWVPCQDTRIEVRSTQIKIYKCTLQHRKLLIMKLAPILMKLAVKDLLDVQTTGSPIFQNVIKHASCKINKWHRW